jgi:anti-sigma B factor antagonist
MHDPGFTVGTARDDGHVVVRLGGELDVAGAPRLDELLRTLDGEAIVVDLSDLDFVDSSGLAVFVRARNRGQQLRLRTPGRSVRLAFAVSGLDQVFELDKS